MSSISNEMNIENVRKLKLLPEKIISRKYISVDGIEDESKIDKYHIYDSLEKYIRVNLRNEKIINYLRNIFKDVDVIVINARGNGLCLYNAISIFLHIIDHKRKFLYEEPEKVSEYYYTKFIYESDKEEKLS